MMEMQVSQSPERHRPIRFLTLGKKRLFMLYLWVEIRVLNIHQ
jgi:hypothetical protein